MYGPGLGYRGNYNRNYSSEHGPPEHPGGATPPVYEPANSQQVAQATVKNPHAVQLMIAVRELAASEVLPRVCAVLVHELRFKCEAAWVLDVEAMFKLVSEVKDLIALLAHPAELLEKIRGEQGSAAA